MGRPKIVVIGGGFGGLNAAKVLGKGDAEVFLIDRTNHHLFQPLLYQVAGAALSPNNVAVPIREELRSYENITVLMADVVAIDTEKHLVLTSTEDSYPYDFLIVATGARHSYFGRDEWEKYAPGLKTITDAIRIRENILWTFERAEKCLNPIEAEMLLRFVIIGGGPTGVEMAGAIAEIAHKSLFENFRHIKPEQAQIFLIEGSSQILPSYPIHLADRAQKDLIKLGVHVLINTKVTDIVLEGVYAGEHFIPASTIIWAAGNQASPMLKSLNVPLDKQGRVIVEPDLSIPGHSDVFVIGDAAHVEDAKGQLLPGTAPVAMQQGRYVAKNLNKNIQPGKRLPFKYHDKGSMATIGQSKAVAVVGRFQFAGLFAWLAWGAIHILYLISFRNRIIVLFQWFLLYLTGDRNARLITRPHYKKQ